MEKLGYLRRVYEGTYRRHRSLEVEGRKYCGDPLCKGACGLPKIVRFRPASTIESIQYNSSPITEPVILEQASALSGIEQVWSGYRWTQSQWEGDIIICKYDSSEPYWR